MTFCPIEVVNDNKTMKALVWVKGPNRLLEFVLVLSPDPLAAGKSPCGYLCSNLFQ